MFWISAFLDYPADDVGPATTHWERVTGYHRSSSRGPDDEFVSLLPPEGDGHLRVQRLGDGPPRIHLDLHVDDPVAVAAEAERLGAAVVHPPDAGDYGTLTSPGGFTFCLVQHPAGAPAPPATWPGHLSSSVDQVCLDIPSSSYDAECAFWQALTGWELRASPTHPEFRRLVRPEGQPLQLLLQRLGEPDGPVRAHLDLATTDRHAETRRHVDCGAEVLHVADDWTVLADPSGMHYCITDRTPETRVLDEPVDG